MNTQNTTIDPFFVPPPSETQGNFVKDIIKPGVHPAVCCQIHAIGHQLYKGQVSQSPQCILVFEVDQKMVGGKMEGQNMVISETFAMYMNEGSKLRAALEGWRGVSYNDADLKGMSLGALLKRPVTLMIKHEKKQDGTMKAKIAGFLPATGPGWEPNYLDAPQWIKDKIAAKVPAPVKHDPKGPATHDASGEALPF